MGEALDPIHNDVAHMRDAVFFEGPGRQQRLSRFWILLILATIIAAAGVVGDATATVIGAMIVAPMMLPIQGTMLSTVLGDRPNLVRSILLVIAGAAAAVAISFAIGLLVPEPITAATNSQVASRVSPGLIDLLAALGTGIVGSIALIRRDISDTLPGVAIAISLVPPLAVVGLTMESGVYVQSLGALLLFVTNVAAILATGVVVMALYGVQRMPEILSPQHQSTVNRRNAVLVIIAMLIVVGIPLTITSVTFAQDSIRSSTIQSVASNWASESGWDLATVTTTQEEVTVRFTGPLPLPDTAELERQLVSAGVDTSLVLVELIPTYTVDFGVPSK